MKIKVISKRKIFTDQNLKYWLLLPVFFVTLAVAIIPLVYSIGLSFFKWIVTRPDLPISFVGLGNWVYILGDMTFWEALSKTLIFTASVIVIEFSLGLGIALLLNRPFYGAKIILPLMILPVMLSPIVVGLMWRYLYNGDFGLVAWILKTIGFEKYSLLSYSSTALPAVLITDIWHWTPFIFILIFAGLHSLPGAPFEAARVDGATKGQIFRWVTLPLLKRVIMVAILLRTIDAFKIMDEIFIMTSGGPGRATETLSMLIYRQSFRYFTMGKGAVLAVVSFVVILFMCQYFIKFATGKEEA